MIDLKKIPKTEFASAVAQIAGERNIDAEVVLESVKSAILAAFKRDAREKGEEISEEEEEVYKVELDPESGGAKVFFVGDKGEKKDITPVGFGRIAAQTAKQVILQKIREAEKSALIDQFKQRLNTLATGVVLRIEGPRVIVGIGKAEAIMPKEEQVRGERYYSSQRLAFYVKEIGEIDEQESIIVSRSAPELVVELFRREVPEVGSGAVEIKKIARRAGERTKIAVSSTQAGVDPVGSCVGQKGVRVQSVIQELNEEKVDVIPFNDNINQFIIVALSPASEVQILEIDKEAKKVVVEVPEEELAMAIGDGGENVSLAGELTGYEIKVQGKESPKEKPKASDSKSGVKGQKAKKDSKEEEKEVLDQKEIEKKSQEGKE